MASINRILTLLRHHVIIEGLWENILLSSLRGTIISAYERKGTYILYIFNM